MYIIEPNFININQTVMEISCLTVFKMAAISHLGLDFSNFKFLLADTPISELLSYKGSVSVEASRRSFGKRRNFC